MISPNSLVLKSLAKEENVKSNLAKMSFAVCSAATPPIFLRVNPDEKVLTLFSQSLARALEPYMESVLVHL